jgi:hypothetical protein
MVNLPMGFVSSTETSADIALIAAVTVNYTALNEHDMYKANSLDIQTISVVKILTPQASLFFNAFYSMVHTPTITHEPVLDTSVDVFWGQFASDFLFFFQSMFLGNNNYALKPFGMSQHWTVPSSKMAWNMAFPPYAIFVFENKQIVDAISENKECYNMSMDVQVVLENAHNNVSNQKLNIVPGSEEVHLHNLAPVNGGGPISTIAKKKQKTETPLVVSSVRRGLRSDKEGYIPMELPSGSKRCKKSSVKLALTPEVLQMEAMQKMGVEMCGLEPSDLTAERLLQARPT